MSKRRSRPPAHPAVIDRPSFASRAPLDLAEIPAPASTAHLINAANSYLRAYRLGDCSVLVTREGAQWHLSIAHPRRYPRWEEVSEAWYRVIPGADRLTAAMILPPRAAYINRHEFCMHVWQIDDPSFAEGGPS